MKIDDLAFFLMLLPLFGAALAFCAGAFFRGRLAVFFEYTGAFIGLGLPFLVLAFTFSTILSGAAFEGIVGAWNSGVGVAYRFDGLAWLVNLMGYSVAGAAWVYSLGAGPHGPHFTAVFLIQCASVSATAMTADLFNFFVCLEIMGVATYVLIASSGKPGAILGAFSYLMGSAAAMVFFLIGIYGLYRLTGYLSYEGIKSGMNALPDGGGTTAIVSLSLIVSSIALRVAIMPLHGWLPDAYAHAPHAVSAMLSGIVSKAPLFALSRLLHLIPQGSRAGELMGYAGAFTALAAVLLALAQKDVKKLLAYHSVSQAGYIVCAWGAAMHSGGLSPQGLALMSAAVIHALYHALFKSLLFLTVGTVSDLAGERNVYRLREAVLLFRARGEMFPVTLVCFGIAALSIAGLPPFNGFASKAALSHALRGNWQYGFIFAASIGTIASFIKLSRIFWPLRSPPSTTAPMIPAQGGIRDTIACAQPPAKINPAIQAGQSVLALLSLAGAVFAPMIYRTVYTLLAGGIKTGFQSPPLYSTKNLTVSVIIGVSGLMVFIFTGSAAGRQILTLIRAGPTRFHRLFVFYALSTAVLVGWLVYFR